MRIACVNNHEGSLGGIWTISRKLCFKTQNIHSDDHVGQVEVDPRKNGSNHLFTTNISSAKASSPGIRDKGSLKLPLLEVPPQKKETPPEAVRSHTGSNPAPRLFSPTWPGRVAASLKKNFIIATRGPVAAERPTREPVQSVRRWEFSRAPLGFRHSCVQTNKTGLNQMDLRKRKSYSFSKRQMETQNWSQQYRFTGKTQPPSGCRALRLEDPHALQATGVTEVRLQNAWNPVRSFEGRPKQAAFCAEFLVWPCAMGP